MSHERPTPPKPSPARIVVADDHEVVRAGLCSIVRSERGFELIGEAPNGRVAVDLCRDLQPDVILLDVRMPELDGLTATRAIKQVSPNTRVLIITMYENADYLLEALSAGASGYILKDASRDEIVTAVRHILRGEPFLNGALAARMFQQITHANTRQTTSAADRLTPREREVLQHLARGKTNRQIANSLQVTPGTVKIHVEHIIAKLGVVDRTQAAIRALELGLLESSGL